MANNEDRLESLGRFRRRAHQTPHANDRRPSSAKPRQPQRLSARRRLDRRQARSGQAARRQRRHARPDHRSNGQRRSAPAHRSCALLLFESLDKAAHAALEIAALKPAACDLMDRRHLSLARETDVRYELLIPGEAEACCSSSITPTAARNCDTSWTSSSSWCSSNWASPPRRMSPKTKSTSSCTGAWPSDSFRRSIACKARRGRRPASKTSRSRSQPASVPAARARHAQASASHGLGLRPRGPRPTAHSPVSRSAHPTTMSARWNRWPPSSTKKSGCSAARSAASTATA